MDKILPKFKYPMNFLPCDDLESIRAFYHDILGLKIALEQGPCLIFKVGESPHISYWGFCSHYTEKIGNPSKVCLTLVVNSEKEVNEWYDFLTAKNVQCTKKPAQNMRFKIYHAFFLDPVGYSVEIQYFYPDGEPLFV